MSRCEVRSVEGCGPMLMTRSGHASARALAKYMSLG